MIYLIALVLNLTIAYAADTANTQVVETKKSAANFEMITVPVKTVLPGSTKEQPVSNQLSFELDPGAEMALGAQGGVAPISCALKGVGTITLNTDKTKCTYKAPDTGGVGEVKIKDADNPPQTLNVSIYSKVVSGAYPAYTYKLVSRSGDCDLQLFALLEVETNRKFNIVLRFGGNENICGHVNFTAGDDQIAMDVAKAVGLLRKDLRFSFVSRDGGCGKHGFVVWDKKYKKNRLGIAYSTSGQSYSPEYIRYSPQRSESGPHGIYSVLDKDLNFPSIKGAVYKTIPQDNSDCSSCSALCSRVNFTSPLSVIEGNGSTAMPGVPKLFDFYNTAPVEEPITLTDCTSAPTRKVFSSPVAGDSYQIPSGCNEIFVKAWGAGGYGNEACGGGNGDYYGGGGGYAKAKISVSAGERLQIYVGEGGKTEGAGPRNGGGGLHGGANWGSGGGYSGVKRDTTPILIAGGGGAAVWGCMSSWGSGGGGGGLDGQTGTGPGSPGYGGTRFAGGAAGTGSSCSYGTVTSGEPLHGGHGCAASGGGGGFYGGGGGSSYGGGGGGSGFMASSGVSETKLITGAKEKPAGTDDPDWGDNAGYGGTPQYHHGKYGRVVVCCTDPNVK